MSELASEPSTRWAGGTERAAPFYCPYCGDEDLRPREEPHGAWLCTGCRRVFSVKFVGLNLAKEEVSR